MDDTAFGVFQTARYRFNGCLRNMRIDGKMPTIQPHYYAVSQCHYPWRHRLPNNHTSPSFARGQHRAPAWCQAHWLHFDVGTTHDILELHGVVSVGEYGCTSMRKSVGRCKSAV